MNGERLFAIALGLISALIWGAHSSVSMLAIREGWTSIDLTATRVAGGLLIALPWFIWYSLNGGRLPWLRVIALSCFAGVLFSLINIAGLQFAPVTHAGAISLGMAPVLVALLSKPLLGTDVARRHWLALSIIIFGIGTIWVGTSLSWTYLLGDLCFLTGASLWALYAIYLRRWQISPLQAAFYTSIGSSPFLIWYLVMWTPPDTQISMMGLQLLFQGVVVGLLAIFLYGKTVSILGPQLGSLFSALPPVVVPVVAAVILDYQPDIYEYLGVVLVVIGMLVAFINPTKPNLEPLNK